MSHSEGFQASYVRRQHLLADRIRLTNRPLLRACLAEFWGTAILIIFGCGVLAQVTLGNFGNQEHGTFISVSLGWGFAVYMGVFFAGRCGSGNINPAISLAFALIGKLPLKRVPFYIISQVLGAFVGALAVYGVYHEKIYEFADKKDGGILQLETTGNIFVTNPWASHYICFFDQVLGTALLSAGALAIGDENGWNLPDFLHPLHFAFLVYALVGAFAVNAGCALNPARDLGPRLMLLVSGWGTKAFTGANYFFWVPILGPFIGAIIGACMYELTIGIHLDRKKTNRLSIENDVNDKYDDTKDSHLLTLKL